MQPFDQGEWAERYAAYDFRSACGCLAPRDWNLKLLGESAPRKAQRPITHPERGTMTFWTIIETMAGHDINHLKQIERLAAGLVKRRGISCSLTQA